MQLRMQDPRNWETDQIRQLLDGSAEVVCQGQNQAERYEWIEKTLGAQQ